MILYLKKNIARGVFCFDLKMKDMHACQFAGARRLQQHQELASPVGLTGMAAAEIAIAVIMGDHPPPPKQARARAIHDRNDCSERRIQTVAPATERLPSAWPRPPFSQAPIRRPCRMSVAMAMASAVQAGVATGGGVLDSEGNTDHGVDGI